MGWVFEKKRRLLSESCPSLVRVLPHGWLAARRGRSGRRSSCRGCFKTATGLQQGCGQSDGAGAAIARNNGGAARPQ